MLILNFICIVVRVLRFIDLVLFSHGILLVNQTLNTLGADEIQIGGFVVYAIFSFILFFVLFLRKMDGLVLIVEGKAGFELVRSRASHLPVLARCAEK